MIDSIKRNHALEDERKVIFARLAKLPASSQLGPHDIMDMCLT